MSYNPMGLQPIPRVPPRRRTTTQQLQRKALELAKDEYAIGAITVEKFEQCVGAILRNEPNDYTSQFPTPDLEERHA